MKKISIRVEVIVAPEFDFLEKLEDFKEAVGGALDTESVTVLSAEESDAE